MRSVNTPQFSGIPGHVPATSIYLLSSVVSSGLVLLNHLCSFLDSGNDGSSRNFRLDESAALRSWENTKPAELQDRALRTPFRWNGAYCTMLGLWLFGSIVGVGLALSSVHTWRPLFGPLREAYTLQMF